jgi:CXXX repeat peptide maturase
MENNSLQSVIIIPDDTAPSFCCYSTGNGKNEIMPVETLKKCIRFCEARHLPATVPYGRHLSGEHLQVLNGFEHIRVISAEEMNRYELSETDIIAADFDGLSMFGRFAEGRKYNVVLRMNREDAGQIPMTVYQYHSLFNRLNVVFKDIPGAGEEALNRFRLDIQPLKDVMYRLFTENRLFEFNMVTDRWMLKEVKSCDAGIRHVTIAPDGRYYICPAFYYDGEKQAAGSPDEGLKIPNSHLLRMEYATLCRLCDCYQCRRCIYLNRKLTREWNTPSHQQCVLSHHERNLSGMLLQKLQNRGMLSGTDRIPPLYCLDPLDIYKDMDK